jgi:hypothetical protein
MDTNILGACHIPAFELMYEFDNSLFGEIPDKPNMPDITIEQQLIPISQLNLAGETYFTGKEPYNITEDTIYQPTFMNQNPLNLTSDNSVVKRFIGSQAIPNYELSSDGLFIQHKSQLTQERAEQAQQQPEILTMTKYIPGTISTRENPCKTLRDLENSAKLDALSPFDNHINLDWQTEYVKKTYVLSVAKKTLGMMLVKIKTFVTLASHAWPLSVAKVMPQGIAMTFIYAIKNSAALSLTVPQNMAGKTS